ncbi:MAG: Ig-like domain-containing protein, partial [Clostridia bacterium]|nr:Ig-like domain-containing protein [Clostridia bacterium]
TPTRAGYVFLFWAASPESKLPVSGKIDATAENSVTLYAVWDKNDHWEFDTYKNSFHPEGISKFSFKNGIFSYNMVSGGSIDNLKNVGYSTDTTSKKLTMRLRWKVDDASGLRAVAAVWTDKVEKYPSSAELSYDISRYGAAPEDFVTIVLDGTSFKYFESNTLNNFRFYPINKPGECEIDYIRFTDSEANIVVSVKLNAASDEVSYIVPESSVIAPNGVAVWKALHLAGGIDFSNGIAVIKGIFEDAGDGGYKAFVLDMDKENVSVADAMQVGDYYVPLINGATYIMPEETDVSFIRQENTTGINVTIEGPDEVFVGDGETAYTAVFDTDMENDSVMWHVDRTDIATVDENGVLTAIKEGAVRLTAISAIDSSINASINVTVSKHIFSLTLKGAENIVVDENTYSYKADFNGDIPKNTAVKYSTDNPDVASIDADSGELTINGAGRVRIVATSAYDPQITAELTVNIRYADFELSIEGPDILKREGRSEKYTAIKTGEHTGKMTYTWTVSDSNKAVISADGKLSPKDNGEITIRAVSNYNPKIFAEKTVTITGQSGLYSVTYHSGTQDAVTGLPETAFGKNSFALSDAVPEREGYYFLGWTLGMDSVTTVTELDLKSDADVYALWGKGVSYEFNGSMDGVTWVMDGSSKLSGNGYMIVNTYGGTRLYMKGMSINPDTHKNIEIRMSVDNKSYVKIYYTAEVDNPDGSVTKLGYANNGYKDAERLSKSLAHSKT